jgi:hypothetical protein
VVVVAVGIYCNWAESPGPPLLTVTMRASGVQPTDKEENRLEGRREVLIPGIGVLLRKYLRKYIIRSK